MSETNKSFRIRTNVNADEQYVNVDFTQNYEKIEILSLEINQSNSYRLMNSNTGIVVGRVLANEGFGIPNAKVSVFIRYDNTDDFNSKLNYQYTSTFSTNEDGVRYNLLPDSTDDMCQQAVGSFPSKRYVLDNNDVIEVFDKYYTYTTRTNNSGDYMIYGVPTGQQTVHCDIDLSDIGVLSQTPRDMVYKGYNLNLFESPSKFKSSTDLNSLAQIKSQDTPVFVYPFWGDTTDDPTGAAVTRCDISISYKFEPTCVFIGSIVTDTGQNAVSKKCVPSKVGGKMSEMTSGAGMIEMIRKTVNGDIEQIAIKGNEVIDDDGVWCYQIPMNLDYVMTDEYGNTVLSDNPNKGIPTRTRVRFRISMHENPADGVARKRARYLVPNNPHLTDDYPEFSEKNEIDYEFGSKTKDEDFRDLMWNNVYTVKNYIPRVQKARLPNNLRFLGIKMTNHSGKNNPMPYNKLSIKFNFMYTFLCVLIKVLIQLTRFVNIIINGFQWSLLRTAHSMIVISNRWFWPRSVTFLAGINGKTPDNVNSLLETITWTFPSDEPYTYHGCSGTITITPSILDDGGDHLSVNLSAPFIHVSPDPDNMNRAAWCAVAYFLTMCCKKGSTVSKGKWDLNGVIKAAKINGLAAICCALVAAIGRGISLEGLCDDENGNTINITPGPNPEKSNFIKFVIKSNLSCFSANNNIAALYNCVENQLAQENEVTSFNFYNDWINGVLYMPLWYRKIKPKKKFLFINLKSKDQWCNGDTRALGNKRRKLKVYSNCVIKRKVTGIETLQPLNDDYVTVDVDNSKANDETGREDLVFKRGKVNDDNCFGYNCHKYGRSETPIYAGLVIEKETMLGDKVYYYKPVYKSDNEPDMVTLFATDIVLLGSLNTCDLHGIPQFFKILEGTSYQMPPDLLSEDYEYLATSDSDSELNTDEDEDLLIDESTRRTEYTGADWGNLGVDQSSYKKGIMEANENIYDNGGLFYGLTCFDSYTKPKSIINLERICEIGVSLDESQDIISDRTAISPNADVADEDSMYTTLTPDGYISFDEIYNPDYRSMFATLNGNFLRTKLNFETGLTEYDLTHVYLDNFDGSLSNIMAGEATHGNMVVNGVDTHKKANYINNSKLEKNDINYTRFRFGNYVKKNGKKLYFYNYEKTMTKTAGVAVKSSSKFPRYENSFYFYFGLTEGKTAIDKFYANYYADCGIEQTFGKAIDISYVGNSWCPPYEGGYITFKCNLDLPLTLTLIDKDAPENVYTAKDITANNFYIGAEDDEVSVKFQHVKVDYSSDSTDSLLSHIQHGNYQVKILDGTGIEHLEEVNFTNDNKITFSVDKYDFNISNENLLSRYSYGEDNYCVKLIKNDGSFIIVTPVQYTALGSMFDGTRYYGYTRYGVITTNSITGEKTYTNEPGYDYIYNFTSGTLTDSSGNNIEFIEYFGINYVDNNDVVQARKYTVAEEYRLIVRMDLNAYSGMEPTNILSNKFYNMVADDGISWITSDEYYDIPESDRGENGYGYDPVPVRHIIGNSSEDVYSKNIEDGLMVRDIFGYLCLSNISEDNFRIEVKPSNDSLSDFIGYQCTVYNGNIEFGGYGHLGVDKTAKKYYIGLPYGNVTYKITVTMLCESDNLEERESANQSTTYVTVYEGSFKMYINGIDYDIIKYFKTGWTDKTMDTISSATFNSGNIRGWNDITNIGLDRTEMATYYPMEPNVIFNTTVATTVDEYNTANGTELTEEEFNTLDNKKYISELQVTNIGLINNIGQILHKNGGYNSMYAKYKTDTTYNWDNEFVIDAINWKSLSDNIEAIPDSEGREPVDDGYIPTFAGDVVDKCELINNVIDLRIDLTKQMMGNFRPNVNGVTEITITGMTKSTPVQYLGITGLYNLSGTKPNRPGEFETIITQ